jgi:FADH2 O2-dependent halogenase
MVDVVIIGGGPAGSAMGSFLSMKGISNIIIEKEIHPRPHVGESMVTSSTRIFEEIGFLPTMEKEAFVHKFGASWHEPGGREFQIRFEEFPQEGIHQPYTYHVDRGKFDLLLFKNAQRLGSQTIQGVGVKQVLFEEDRAVGVRIRLGDQDVDIPAKMVVDASGRSTILGRQLNTKKNDPIFNQYAVHAWYENVARGEIPISEDYIHIYFLPVERGWAWQIPINEKITSMGIVVEREVFREFKGDMEAYFDTYVASNPALKKALEPAKRVNEFKTEGDYSYSMSSFVGNGFLMVGDAARFVDPIFSSGVSIALYSAKFAAETIEIALKANNVSEEMLMPYEKKLRGGVSVWYEFIRLYYKLLPLFTHFIQSKKYRLEILRLLQGEVFERSEVDILDAMRRYIETVEKTENHIFKKQLSSIPLDEIPETILASSQPTSP